ncbi:MAG: hypothetical protein ACI8P3_002022 [Saprospiraceae bacterium]|jgi:hypothetical protein
MTLLQFKSSLDHDQPDNTWSPFLQALWYDAKGDWNKAHEIVDPLGGPEGDWIHAYLHRKEGDSWNADYWYQRAGRQAPNISFKVEWEVIVVDVLERSY